MEALFDWFTSLPSWALYGALALTAAIENIFPPLPADTVVAFGSFIAARGHGTALGSFLSTWVGNIAGAMLMYYAGRRFGAEALSRRLMRSGGKRAEERLHALYGKHGIWALVVSRFLPGVRALVPPFAGALRIPPLRAGLAMAAASGAWYGAITVLAFRVGSDFDELVAMVKAGQRWVGLGAVGVVALVAIVWLVRRRRTPA